MKFNYKNIFSWLLVFAAFTLVYSCSEDSGVDDEIVDDGDDDDDDSAGDDDVDLEDYTVYSDYVTIDLDDLDVTEDDGANLVVVNIDDEITLTFTLSAEAEAAGLKDSDFSWDSTDQTCVNIDIYGKIIAASEGMATVSISYIDHENYKIYSDSLNVSVGIIKVESLVIEPSERTAIEQGDSLQLSVTISPSNATYKDVTWSSSNDSLAMVSSSGMVVAGSILGSEFTITATSEDGYGATVSKSFTIAQYDSSVGVAINACPEDYTYPNNEGSATISAAVPQGGDPGEVEWYSLNESVVTAAASGTDGGTTSYAKISFVGLGSAEVVARYYVDINKSRTDTVTVNVPAGYWREEYKEKKELGDYLYSCTTGGTVSTDSQGTYYITVPMTAGGYTNTYQAYYMTSSQPSKVGINDAYPYMVVHMDNLMWKSYYETGVCATKARLTNTISGMNLYADSGIAYKTDRSAHSMLYVLTGSAYNSSVGLTDANSSSGSDDSTGAVSGLLTEFVYGTSTCHTIMHTHDISYNSVTNSLTTALPNIGLYGARTCKDEAEILEYALSLGSNGYTIENFNTSNTDLSSNAAYYSSQIVYSNGSIEPLGTLFPNAGK